MGNTDDKAKKRLKNVNEVYDNDPDGTYSKAGREDVGEQPNDPAANARKTSPEEDSGQKEDTRLKAGNRDPKPGG
ncbi:hypothetical protein [Dyadobacter beijingensis]|nr:hypothetical protein [Dyadobacter beijingensis]